MTRKRRKIHVVDDMPIPIARDPSPKVPPPRPDSQSMEFRVDWLERSVRRIEEVLEGYGPPPPSTPQADAQPREGLILPNPQRDAANLQALSLWTRPECWRVEGTAEERVRTRAMIDHLNSLVQIAINGGEVPRP